jgi:hypothetical protein
MAEPEWVNRPPNTYDVVTGFFPEASPKETWETNPRPLLVCGRAVDPSTGMVFCRVAYGTTQHIDKAHANDLVIGNLSMLDQLGLKKTTRFVINSGEQMVILPWIDEFFRPWTDYPTPVLSWLPEEMQRFVGHVISKLDNLPKF